MSEKPLFSVDLVRLEDIVITNARIDNNTEISNLDRNKYFFDISHAFKIAFNIEQKKVRVVSSSVIKTLEKSNRNEIGINANFDIAFYFSIENLDDFLNSQDLIVSVSNIAYSTSRVIIFTRCQGTIFKSIIIPIISTEKLIDMLKSKKEES
jgi:hypothetical protein